MCGPSLTETSLSGAYLYIFHVEHDVEHHVRGRSDRIDSTLPCFYNSESCVAFFAQSKANAQCPFSRMSPSPVKLRKGF